MEVRVNIRILLSCSAALALAVNPAATQAQTPAVAESKMAQSSVSLLVDPALNDGRLVVRVAAKNLGTIPIRFGPSSISIAKPGGEAIPITPLSSLVDDVRSAAGFELGAATSPTQGAYASPQLNQRDGGRMDVTGFTGGSTVGGDEYVRRSKSKRAKSGISEAEAQAQIAALNQAILQDRELAPGQVAAGQIVSGQLKFAKSEERTLHVRVRVAGEEHGFTIEAPKE